MNVKLIAHTKLSEWFSEYIHPIGPAVGVEDGQAVALTAIRTCYSHNKPTEILLEEGAKYFRQTAKDGEEGTEADRLFRHITRSGHTSTLEHITYTFAIEGVSRALLAQLTRHRVGFSYSVQSQRYVRFGSGDKSRGFDYMTPASVGEQDVPGTDRYDGTRAPYREDPLKAYEVYAEFMDAAQKTYDRLREVGVPAEDARMVLPQAATCNLVMTANLRSLIDFYNKRRAGKGAQWEIAELAEHLREEAVNVDPWAAPYFTTT